MLHKLQKATGERDRRYTLTGSIEMDDADFGGAAARKRDRGAANKTPVAVMVETRGECAGCLAMGRSGRWIRGVPPRRPAPGLRPASRSTPTTGPNGGLETPGHDHHAAVVPPGEAHQKLPWVHMDKSFSNCGI